MKKLFLFFAMFMAITVSECYSQSGKSQKRIQRYKQESMVKAYIERMVSDTTFMISISQGGSTAYNSSLGLPGISSYSGYFVKFVKNRFAAYLPYSGARTGSSLTGGGIDVDVEDYKLLVERGKKGTSWHIHVECATTKGDHENYIFDIDLSDKGVASMSVLSSARESVNYLGGIAELSKEDFNAK